MASEKKRGPWAEKYLLPLLVRLVRALPHGAALIFGAFMGNVLWLFSKRRVDRAERRCVAALGVGVTPAREIVRASYAGMGRSAVEFARMRQLLPRLRDLISIEGKEYLDGALARGRGALVMTAHLGNWELAGARLVAEGYPVTPIYTPQRNRGGVNDLIERERSEAAGFNLVPSRGPGLREAFRTLRERGILFFLQDLDARREGLLVPFLGIPASTAIGIVKMHRKFGAPIVPMVTLRNPDGYRHTIQVQKILSDFPDEDGEPFGTNMAKSLQMCNNILSDWVAKYPDQWMWLLDRWGSVEKEKRR
ncbi:MAG: lipid A biosynthesis acyltransferase [Synergistaceae bacterium]|nr:lipid A biosynthesis acyltransferase [Synergistaceae bacterium]